MNIFQAVVLGAIQGVTEFLPISSSGHLVVVPWLFGWQPHSLTFDVVLHLGSLVAIVAYFWADWRALLRGTASDMERGMVWRGANSRLVILIILASIPGALAGIALENKVEAKFHTAYLGIAGMMILMGIVLLVADGIGKKKRDTVGTGTAAGIGFAQMLALFPGVSRSGATITAGLFAGLTREAAARFSFLLATPIILGAGLLKLAKMAMAIRHHQPLENPMSILLIGFVVSAVVGYGAIAGLLSWLRTRSMLPFVVYRVAFGLLLIGVYLMRR